MNGRIGGDIDRMYKEVRYAFKQGTMTRQEYRTLKGQLKKGDWEAAERGFATIMERQR